MIFVNCIGFLNALLFLTRPCKRGLELSEMHWLLGAGCPTVYIAWSQIGLAVDRERHFGQLPVLTAKLGIVLFPLRFVGKK